MPEPSPSSRPSRLPAGALAAAVFALALVILLVVFNLGDEQGGLDALGDYDPRAVEESVQEALTPVRLRRSDQLRLTAREVRWNDGSGRPFLETPRITVTIQLGAAPDGGILLSDGVIVRPRLRLVQTGEDRWNYERPLARLLDEDRGAAAGGAEAAVRLRNVAVRDGYVLLDLLDARYEARSLDARVAFAELSGPGVDAPLFQISRASTQLVMPDTGSGRVSRGITLSDARVRVLDGAMFFDVDGATFGQSTFAALSGVWNPALGGMGLDLRLTAVHARLADLPWLPGQVPEGASGSFRLRVEPRPGDRTALTLTALDLRAPGSAATGSLRAVLGGPRPVLESVDLRLDPLSLELAEAFAGPLPYGGTVAGTVRGTGGDIRFDLRGRLTTASTAEPFSTDISGRAVVTEEGFTLRTATISLDRLPLRALNDLAPGLPFSGPISGTVELTGAPGEGPLALNVRFEAGGGIVMLQGTADLSGVVPSYDLNGRLVGVRLRAILEPEVPPVEVHARFALKGRGTDPRTANATVVANGRFTGWESEPGDTLAIRARVVDGTVDVQDLRVEAGPIHLAAAGRWDYLDGGGTLGYQVIVSDLGPLRPYLPAEADGSRRFSQGSVVLTGTASGTLQAPSLAGEVAAREFRWGEWAAESFGGEYAVTLAEGLPRIDTELTADDLRTPFGAFDAMEARIDFGRPTFEVAIRADQEGGRGILAIEADGRIEETGQREVFLRSLEVDLRRQRWRLQDQARIAWTAGDRVRVAGLELLQVDGDGRMAVSGVVAPMDDLDLSVDVAALPVGDVLELVGSDVELAGSLSVTGRVAGPASDPDLDVALTLSEGAFRGVAIRAVSTSVRYEDRRLVVDGDGLLGDSARIRIAGTIPALLQPGESPFLALVDDAPIDLEIVTRTFPLSTLDPGFASVEDVEGRLEASLRLGGTPAEPRLSGSAQLLHGAVTVPLLGRRFENIEAAVLLSGREARIRRLVVESDGTARVEGTLDFQQLTSPVLNLTAVMERFRLQEVEDERSAGLWGRLRLEGTPGNPVLSGSIRADNGAVSLLPLQQPELSARLVQGPPNLAEFDAELDFAEPAAGGLRIRNLTLIAGDDLWFVTREARARLRGMLTMEKNGSAMPIQGTLQGEAGTFVLNAGPIIRQFQIVSSEIRFLGSPEPNPRIEIVASRVVRLPDGGGVDVRVQVSGSLQNLSLSLGAATGASVPESELLSFLLFGRPSSDLGTVAGVGGPDAFLGQSLLAYSGLTEVLASQFIEEVGFLDYLRVDFVPGGGLFATAGVEVLNGLFLETDLPLEGQSNYWAVGLEYDWAPVGTFRGGYEPVLLLDRVVGRRALSVLQRQRDIEHQFTLAWRRRWTY